MSDARASSPARTVILGFALLAVAGGCTTSVGIDNAATRRFDQYPILLEFAGGGTFESGETGTLTITADGLQFRANPGFTLSESFGVEVTKDAAIGVEPSMPILDQRWHPPQFAIPEEFMETTINVTVPAVTSVRRFELRATNARSDISRAVFVVPPGVIYVKLLTLSERIAETGQEIQGTVALSSPAGTGGVAVTLVASDSGVTMPSSVTVPAGQSEVSFSVLANAPPEAGSGQSWTRITAALNGAEQQAGLWIRQSTPFLLAFRPREELEPVSVHLVGGSWVVLSRPAPAGGASVALASGNSLVTVPASVTVPEGATLEEFSLRLEHDVFERTAARLTAAYGGVQRIADVSFGTGVRASLKELSVGGTRGICLAPNDGDLGVGVDLEGTAPPGYRVEIYSTNQRVLRLRSEVSAIGGENSLELRRTLSPPLFGEALDSPDSRERELARFIQIGARAVDTGQELRADVGVRLGSGPITDLSIDSIEVDAEPARGDRALTGRVVPNVVHPFDDVPYYIFLLIPNHPSVEYRGVIPRGRAFGNFSIDVPAVSAAADATLRARVDPCGEEAIERPIGVIPAGGVLQSMSVDRPYLFVGETANLEIRLSAPAPIGGVLVHLEFSANYLHAAATDVPIGEGSDASALIALTALPVSAVLPINIRATSDGDALDTSVTVMPEPAPGDLTLAMIPPSVVGGQAASIEASLPFSYPVPLEVTLGASHPSVSVPATLQIPAHQSSVRGTVTTTPVSAIQDVSILGLLRSISAGTSLHVTPLATGLFSLTLEIYGTGNGAVTYDITRDLCTRRDGGNTPTVCVWGFAAGTAVTLTAFPNAGYTVGDWVGCDSINPSGTECHVTLDSDRTVKVFLNTPAP
jgi:hypothetical protein